MKKWGLLVTAYYALTVLAMFLPLFWVWVFHQGSSEVVEPARASYLGHIWFIYTSDWIAISGAVAFLGQIPLLFLSIGTSSRRLKPHAHIALPAILTGLFLAVLGSGMATSILMATYSEHSYSGSRLFSILPLLWPALWVGWAIIFYRYARNDENPIARAVSWILRGSILEFLVVVPCHIIVRRRNECCAYYFTSLGLCTGLAMMLIAFGPSVLLLYRKRLAEYKVHKQSIRP